MGTGKGLLDSLRGREVGYRRALLKLGGLRVIGIVIMQLNFMVIPTLLFI